MFSVLEVGSRVCQKGLVTDDASGVGESKWGVAKAYLEGCLEHRSTSPFSDSP